MRDLPRSIDLRGVFTLETKITFPVQAARKLSVEHLLPLGCSHEPLEKVESARRF